MVRETAVTNQRGEHVADLRRHRLRWCAHGHRAHPLPQLATTCAIGDTLPPLTCHR
jgi:hypothetical protein